MLELADKRRALPLFEKLAYNLVAAAVVDGIAAGTVYADNILSPRTALLWAQSHGLYLAGEAADGEVIASRSSSFREATIRL